MPAASRLLRLPRPLLLPPLRLPQPITQPIRMRIRPTTQRSTWCSKRRTTTKAIPAFQGFIKQYPSSGYVPNAHYWLGQLLFNKGDRSGAAAQFSTVANKYSKSPKRADALLKLGMLAQLDGKKAEAKSFYEQVIKGYPGTTSAKLAEQSQAKL